MSFPRYPAYKPSGVEWLGEVPEHWEATRLSRKLENMPCYGVLVPEYVDQGIPMLRINDIENGHALRGDLKQISIQQSDEYSRTLLEEDDIALAVVGTIGRSLIVDAQLAGCNLSRAVAKLRTSPGLSPRILRWIFESLPFEHYTDLMCVGSAQRVLNMNTLASFTICIPPYDEQTAIDIFLDREIAKIDALIAEQQRLIELLQEKRQAVISHAVTKGLNPDAPMKDSGVEWLGEVPEHWEVIQLKWLTPVKRGASPRPIDDPIYFDEQGEYAWVRISDVTESSGRLTDTTQRLSVLGSDLSIKLEPGALFLSIAGSVGKPCISEIKACIHDGFVYFPHLPLSPEYLMLIFECGTCFGGLGKLGTQLNLNTDTIGSIYIAVPPEADEIESIIQHCSSQSGELRKLSESVSSAISLLQERRSALISAAVTGQIDVRGLAPVANAA